MDAFREGQERQLLTLKALRESSLSDVQVCIECFVPRANHGKSDHWPRYWEIDEAISKLEYEIKPPVE